MLRYWKDVGLADMVSINATFVNPAQVADVNGDIGETKVIDLYLAIQQAVLAADIADTVSTTVTLDQPMFFDANYLVIVVGTEKMLITGGNGTDTLTVQRGYNGTTAATHTTGDRVYSAYNATEITITSVDNSGTDESGWLTFRDYGSGSYESPHAVADLAYNASAHLQFQAVVPVWPSAYKRDIVPKINCKLAEIPNP